MKHTRKSQLFSIETKMNNTINIHKRRVVIVSLMLLIATIHLMRAGRYLPAELYPFYAGYFSDIALPFGGYFLLCAAEMQMPILRHWITKLLIAFLLPSLAETCQYFGIPVLGSTFDPLDYFMYGIGATLAVIVDTQIFFRIFNFWNLKKTERQ